MHVVIMSVQLRSSASDGATAETIHALLTETRDRDGCREIETFVDTKDPSKIVIIEHWDSKEANKAYLAWRQGDGAAGARSFGALLAQPPSVVSATPAPEL